MSALPILVRTTTDDACLLDGALSLPIQEPAQPLPVSAVLLVHGTGSNFYAPGVLETFARLASEAGIAALRINTRGHDGISQIPRAGRSLRGGAAFEQIADCRRDLRAWVQFLRDRDHERIGLAGHSMGGVKSAYTLAHDPLPEVKLLIVISSPRFCHARFAAHPNADAFRRDYAEATRLVAEGRGEQLLQVMQPMPLVITAGGFVEKYGPDDPYDLLHWLPRVGRPARVILGDRSAQKSIAFDGLAESIEELSQSTPHLSLDLVPGADINYTGCDQLPFERALDWLRQLPG